MRYLILFLLLTGYAAAGCFVHPTSLIVAMRGSPVLYPAPWVSVTRPQALSIEAIPHHYRKWVTDHVEEMSAEEKAAVVNFAESQGAGALFIRWNASKMAIEEFNILFPEPSDKEQEVLDSITAYKIVLKSDLGLLGITVP